MDFVIRSFKERSAWNISYWILCCDTWAFYWLQVEMAYYYYYYYYYYYCCCCCCYHRALFYSPIWTLPSYITDFFSKCY